MCPLRASLNACVGGSFATAQLISERGLYRAAAERIAVTGATVDIIAIPSVPINQRLHHIHALKPSIHSEWAINFHSRAPIFMVGGAMTTNVRSIA
jgi:hypothetical protein